MPTTTVRRFASVALLLLASSVAYADIYKWTDANGRTQISDRPPADGGAERVRIRVHNSPAETPSAGEEPAAPKVVMLSTAWCGVCRRARSWFEQNGIAFTEYDVEKNDVGKAEYRRLSGRGVPIILVGDQRMDGFSPARLKTMLPAAQ